MAIAKVDYCELVVFVGDQNWQGGPVLAAKVGPGDLLYWQTDFLLQVHRVATIFLQIVKVTIKRSYTVVHV